MYFPSKLWDSDAQNFEFPHWKVGFPVRCILLEHLCNLDWETLPFYQRDYSCMGFLYWAFVYNVGVAQVALVVKNPPANVEDIGDAGRFLDQEDSCAGGHGNPLQHSCLENPTDRGAWQATVHRVVKSWTWLKRLGMHAHTMLSEESTQLIYMWESLNQIFFRACGEPSLE